ncbi:hypothetical protein FPV67DRAFT_1662744 [Lyophyllum atratum]|nr:hypothetical protein FPV67DRAFT_1662744 [Lyophyllum atratum]
MPGYKKYQCRYFHSDGRPKIPHCNQGSSCRFLHPGDEGWPGLKPKPLERRVASSLLLPKDKDRFPAKSYTSNSPPHRSEPRSAPLVSQDDLFLRRKVADDEKSYGASSHRRMSLEYFDDHNRGRDSKRSKDVRLGNDNRNPPRSNDNASYPGAKNPTSPNLLPHVDSQKTRATSHNRRKYTDNPADSPNQLTRISRSSPLPKDHPRTNSDHRDASLAIDPLFISTVTTDGGVFPSATEIELPARISSAEKRVQQVVALFRSLSRLSSEATQEAEAQAREDKKLRAYTELSSTLAKVSSTAAAAVMPALAEVLLRQAQGKQRAEDNLKAISGVWSEVFDIFVTEISHAVDAKLNEALKRICEEAELTHRSVQLYTSTPTLKRQRTETEHAASRSMDDSRDRTSDLHEKDADTDARRGSKREQKRRRFFSVSPTPESARQNAAQSTVKSESSIQDILSQMKTKIDEQAQSLQKLTKENNEVCD